MGTVNVVVYTKSYCPYCAAAKRLLSGKKVSFQEIDVTDKADLQADIAKRSGQQTVPQIFINDRPIGGFQELSGLDQSGELDKLLEIGG